MILRRTIEKRCSPVTELDEKEMRRLYGYLARRGFRPGEISSVLEEMEISFHKNLWQQIGRKSLTDFSKTDKLVLLYLYNEN